MSKWNVGRYKIRTRTGGELEVKGLVSPERNLGIHTDPVSQQLSLTILSGPHAGLRHGPSFSDLGEAVTYANQVPD